MDSKLYDLIIIGGGPAGLTAALYASRRKLSTLVITRDIGGQAALTNEIENYPGFDFIEGPELMNKFHQQAEKWGAEFVYQAATKVTQGKDENYTVATEQGEYKALAVILSFGLEHRHLGIPGEEEYSGKGVTYCATCDGPLFKDKDVCVVGGGNSALDAIIYMSDIAKTVKAYVRKDAFKGEEVLVENAKAKKNVEFVFNTELTAIEGETFVTKVKLKNNQTNEESEAEVQGVFVEIGYKPNTEFYKDLVDIQENGAIIIDDGCHTSRNGFFAAGDITTLPYKQVITSGGEGCKAALSAYTYIQKKKGKDTKVGADRGKSMASSI